MTAEAAIRERTFIRWINYLLGDDKKDDDKKVTNIAKDLSDGLIFIKLLELLTNRSFGRYNKRPRIGFQKDENLLMVTRFLKNDNIDSKIDERDVTRGNREATLVLLELIVHHYFICKAVEGLRNTESNENPNPRLRLFQWLQDKVPINNFTSDWVDGKAIGAVVDAMRPGLCPDWEKFDPNDAVQNVAKVMEIAEKELNVPKLLAPEDMASSNLDELSTMIYLCSFLRVTTGETDNGQNQRDEETSKRVDERDEKTAGIEQEKVSTQSQDANASSSTLREEEKQIQEKTIMRWVNHHLKDLEKEVRDLAKDFSDGVNLILLIGVLRGNPILNYNRHPINQAQRVENCEHFLSLIKREGVSSVYIGRGADVVSGDLTLIKELMWSLILHYSAARLTTTKETTFDAEQTKARHFLLQWIQDKVPELSINNLTTDWNDGKALGALVNAMKPGLCTDWRNFKADGALSKATQAMDIAQKELKVPQLLTSEEIVNPQLDEMSAMTYLFQFLPQDLSRPTNTESEEITVIKDRTESSAPPTETGDTIRLKKPEENVKVKVKSTDRVEDNDGKSEEYRMPGDPTAADAEWKRIQQNTFTRWVNVQLAAVNKYVHDIEKDLCDGVKLIELLECLSHKSVGRYTRCPQFRPEMIENCAIALRFIENEKIKLVNIDASDILKGNLKLILGLVWTLILKYQISLPMMLVELNSDGTTTATSGDDLTPKQFLMRWVQDRIPDVEVSNFNKDWNNGKALAALVDAVRSGLFPNWRSIDEGNALDNARKVMTVAERDLRIPQVISPEEITNPNVDELSVMTYISFFYGAK